MKWVLKARDRDASFVAVPNNATNAVDLVTDIRKAKQFNTLAEANNFVANVNLDQLSSLWASRSPELVAIRIGAHSFIVGWWAWFFGLLRELSFFHVLRCFSKRFLRCKRIVDSYTFVEVYVLVWNIIAFVILILFSKHVGLLGVLQWILIAIGIIRVVEIVIYQINVTFLDEYRNLKKRVKDPLTPLYAVRSFRRLVLLTIHNYFEVLVWFAAFYAVAAPYFYSIRGVNLSDISGALYFSIVTMTTLGYGDIHPLGCIGMLLTCAQTMIGVFLAIVVFARVVSLIPRPISMDEFEQ
jgi:hypothetical protein